MTKKHDTPESADSQQSSTTDVVDLWARRLEQSELPEEEYPEAIRAQMEAVRKRKERIAAQRKRDNASVITSYNLVPKKRK